MFKCKLKISVILLLIASCSVALARDPTKPPYFKSANSQDHEVDRTLSGIFRHGDYYIAVINGKTVRVGDQLGEMTVKEITRNSVELDDGLGETELLLLGQNIKHSVKTVGESKN